MGDQTSEGYAPDGALEPDPVGKPDPETIDPQVASMVIDRLRDGTGFPAGVNTIAGVIEWVNNAGKAFISMSAAATEAASLKKLVEGTGLNKDIKTLDDAIAWINAGFDELKRLQGAPKTHIVDVGEALHEACVEGDPPADVSVTAAAGNAVNHIRNELGLSSDIKGVSALVSSLKISLRELKNLQLERESLKQIESAAEATRLYAAVESGSVALAGAPSTPYGKISGGPLSDALSYLQESERNSSDAHHSRDLAAIDDAHTQSFAENPPPTPVDETPDPSTPDQPRAEHEKTRRQHSLLLADRGLISTYLGKLLTRLLGSMTSDLSKDVSVAFKRLDEFDALEDAETHRQQPEAIGVADAGQLSSLLGNILTRILSDGMTSNLGKDMARAFTRIQELEDEAKKASHPLMKTFLNEMLAQSDLDAPSAFDILAACIEMAVFLISKNKAYGDSALDPVRIMSSADPAEQLRVRMDDKLSRLMRGHADGEDALKDLVGYYFLMRVAEKRAGG